MGGILLRFNALAAKLSELFPFSTSPDHRKLLLQCQTGTPWRPQNPSDFKGCSVQARLGLGLFTRLGKLRKLNTSLELFLPASREFAHPIWLVRSQIASFPAVRFQVV